MIDRLAEATRARRQALVLLSPAIAQTTVAAAAAWGLARDIVGHPNPFFAPVAAIVALAISYGDRVQRAIEVTAGVCIGVLAAWPCLALGRGEVLAVGGAVASAMVVSAALSDRRLVLLQAATSAVLVVTIPSSPEGLASARVIDALIGGANGIAIGVLAFPIDPRRLVRRSRPALLDALTEVARAVDDGDPSAARRAARSARALARFADAYADDTAVGAQIAREALLRRAARRPAEPTAPASLELVVHGARALARAAQRVVETGAETDASVLRAVRGLGTAAGLLPKDPIDADSTATRTATLAAANAANHALRATTDLYVGALLVQVRTVAAELLQATGYSEADASRCVREA